MAKAPKKKPITTAPGVTSFCYIDKPDTKFKDAGEFKTNLILSAEAAAPFIKMADDAMEKLKEDKADEIEALEAKRVEWNKNPKNKKKQVEELQECLPYAPEYNDQGEETGNFIFKFASAASGKYKSGPKTGQTWTRSGIDIFDSKGKLLNPENSKTKKRPSFPVWSGSTVRVAFTMSDWVGTVQSGYGIKYYLEAVKVLDLMTGGGRTADGYGFGGEEEGYEGAAADDTTGEDADESGDDDSNSGDEGGAATDF